MSDDVASLKGSFSQASKRRLEDALGKSIDQDEENPKSSESKNDIEEKESSFLNYTISEWFSLSIYSILGLILIIFAFVYFDDCSPIPSLTYYVVVAGILEIVEAIIDFVWRVDEKREEMVEQQKQSKSGTIDILNTESSVAIQVDNLLCIALVGVSIWGAVLIFGNIPRPTDCNSTLFIVAFINVIITFVWALFYIPHLFMMYFK